MGRRRKAKEHHGDASDGGTVDKGALADCLSQTSKIAAECNTILRDLLKGRSPHHHDLQRLASQQATLSELLRMLRLDSTTADGAPLASPMDLLGPLYRSQHSPLSVLKQWDLPPPKPKARGGKGSAAAGARGGGDRAALTRHERCLSVEHYWNSLTPATRRELLRVPIDKMVEVASETGGEGAVKELWEALALLRLSGGRTAAYWRCPMCDVRVVEPSAFLQHLQLYHEDVQYADDDVPLVCTKCSREVVGAYYQNEEDGYPPVVLCMTCCWDEQVLQGTSEELSGAMQLRLPTASHILSPGSSAWSSETGDEDGSEDGEGLGLGGDWGPASDGGADEDGSGDEDGGTPPQEEAVRRSGAPCPAADDAAAGVAVQPPRRPKRTVTEHAAPPRTCLCCVAQEKPDSQLLVDAILEQLAALSSTRRDQLERVLALLMTHAHRVYSRGYGGPDPGEAGRGAGGAGAAADAAAALSTLRAPGALASPRRWRRAVQGALDALPCEGLHSLLALVLARHGDALAELRRSPLPEVSRVVDMVDAADLVTPPGSPRGASPRGASPRGTSPRAAARAAPASGVLEGYDPACPCLFVPGPDPPRARLAASAHSVGGPEALQALIAGDEALRAALLAHLGDAGGGDAVAAAGAGAAAPGPALRATRLAPAAWWLDHLVARGYSRTGGASEPLVLQWVYGAVALAPGEEAAARRRAAGAAGGGPGAGVLGAYAALADAWRSLASTAEQRRHVRGMRDALREDVRALDQYPPAWVAGLVDTATAFARSVPESLRSREADFLPPGCESGEREANAAFLKALSRAWSFDSGAAPAWVGEAAARLADPSAGALLGPGPAGYAAAQLQREASLLELAEEVDAAEADAAQRELAGVLEGLSAARAEAAEVGEASRRAAAEGPAPHRRRDAADRAAKEAEHRELLAALGARLAAAEERVAGEEAYAAGARERAAAALQVVDGVREEASRLARRRAAFAHACEAALDLVREGGLTMVCEGGRGEAGSGGAARGDAARGDGDAGAANGASAGRPDPPPSARAIGARWAMMLGVLGALAPPGGARPAAGRAAHERAMARTRAALHVLDGSLAEWWADLDRERRAALELAVVDLGGVVEGAALRVVRRELEARAGAAREAATRALLSQLDAEEGGGGAAGASKKTKKKARKKATAASAAAGEHGAEGGGEVEDGGEAAELAAAQEAAAEKAAAAVAEEARAAAERAASDGAAAAAEAEYEAALEMRRRELESQAQKRRLHETELLRLAEAASLRDAAAARAREEDAAVVCREEAARETPAPTQAPRPERSAAPKSAPPPVPATARNAPARQAAAKGSGAAPAPSQRVPPPAPLFYKPAAPDGAPGPRSMPDAGASAPVAPFPPPQSAKYKVPHASAPGVVVPPPPPPRSRPQAEGGARQAGAAPCEQPGGGWEPMGSGRSGEDVQGPSIMRAAASRQPSPTPARTRTPPAYAGPATPALSAPGPPHGTPPANCHGTQAGGWPGLMQGQLAVGHGQANAQATAHQAPAWEPQGGTTGESLRQHHLAPSLPGDPFAAAPPPRFDAFNGYGRVAPGLGEWPALHQFDPASLLGWPAQGPAAGPGAGVGPGDVLWASRGEAEGLPPHAPPAASAYAGFDLGGGGYAPPSGPPFGAREAEAGAMDDWSELQAQLPSDLGDVLNL